MDKVLVRWSSNWQDEIEIEGLDIMRKSKWEALKKKIMMKKNFCVYAGVREQINYASGEDLLSEIKVRKITPEEERIVKKFIGGSSFGNINFLYVMDEPEEETVLGIEEDDDL